LSIVNQKMQNQERKFEILKGLPPYGEMYISIPNESFSEGLPVKFIKDDGNEWIANFDCGESEFNYISKLEKSDKILVIARGICYIMNRNRAKPIRNFGYDFKEVLEFESKLILIGQRNIAIVENSNEIEKYQDLCFDFIKNIRIENRKLKGTLYDYNASDSYDKNDFVIDLDTYEFTNPIPKFVKKNIMKKTKNKFIKWWKIWK